MKKLTGSLIFASKNRECQTKNLNIKENHVVSSTWVEIPIEQKRFFHMISTKAYHYTKQQSKANMAQRESANLHPWRTAVANRTMKEQKTCKLLYMNWATVQSKNFSKGQSLLTTFNDFFHQSLPPAARPFYLFQLS